MKELNEKIDRVFDEIVEIKISQVKTEADIREHIKRTELAEQNIELLRKELDPVKKHVDFINVLVKIIAILSACLIFFKEIGWLEKLTSLLR